MLSLLSIHLWNPVLYTLETSLAVLGRDHMNNADASSFQYKVLQVHTIANLVQGQQVILRIGGSVANAGTITTNYSPNLTNQFSGYLIR